MIYIISFYMETIEFTISKIGRCIGTSLWSLYKTGDLTQDKFRIIYPEIQEELDGATYTSYLTSGRATEYIKGLLLNSEGKTYLDKILDDSTKFGINADVWKQFKSKFIYSIFDGYINGSEINLDDGNIRIEGELSVLRDFVKFLGLLTVIEESERNTLFIKEINVLELFIKIYNTVYTSTKISDYVSKHVKNGVSAPIFYKTNEDAIIPTNAHPSDVGFDLTIIKVCKKISNKITLYDTGISVQPPFGY